jgi:hypothetical protein
LSRSARARAVFGFTPPAAQEAIETNIFQSLALLAVGEIEILRHIDFRDVDGGGLIPNADQPVRCLVRKRFQQDTFYNAKDHRIGSNANRHGNQNYGREKRRAAKPPENLLELANKRHHEVS